MSYKETIESFIYDYPILEFHYLDRKDLIFSEKVRFLCEHECEHYGHSWACPPAIGSIESCIKKCEKFSRAFLFSTIAQVEDSLNFEACLKARKEHEDLTLELRDPVSARSSAKFWLSLPAACSVKPVPIRTLPAVIRTSGWPPWKATESCLCRPWKP